MRFYLWEPKKDVEHKDTSDEVKDVAPDAVNETQGKPHAAAEPKDSHRHRSKRTTAGRLSKAFRSFFGLPKKKKRQHHHQERTVVIRELSRNPSRPEIILEEVAQPKEPEHSIAPPSEAINCENIVPFGSHSVPEAKDSSSEASHSTIPSPTNALAPGLKKTSSRLISNDSFHSRSSVESLQSVASARSLRSNRSVSFTDLNQAPAARVPTPPMPEPVSILRSSPPTASQSMPMHAAFPTSLPPASQSQYNMNAMQGYHQSPPPMPMQARPQPTRSPPPQMYLPPPPPQQSIQRRVSVPAMHMGAHQTEGLSRFHSEPSMPMQQYAQQQAMSPPTSRYVPYMPTGPYHFLPPSPPPQPSPSSGGQQGYHQRASPPQRGGQGGYAPHPGPQQAYYSPPPMQMQQQQQQQPAPYYYAHTPPDDGLRMALEASMRDAARPNEMELANERALQAALRESLEDIPQPASRVVYVPPYQPSTPAYLLPGGRPVHMDNAGSRPPLPRLPSTNRMMPRVPSGIPHGNGVASDYPQDTRQYQRVGGY